MSRSNRPVMVDGVEEWISRSVVVVPFVFRIVKNEVYFLTECRGAILSHPGEYCGPCGFIDYDENLNEACSREVREETGLEFDPDSFHFLDIYSEPEGKAQNISVRFINLQYCEKLPELSLDNVQTKDEVTELFWKKIGCISGTHITVYKNWLSELKWAFGHDELMLFYLRICENHFTVDCVEKYESPIENGVIKDGVYDGQYTIALESSNICVKVDEGIRGTYHGTFRFSKGKVVDDEIYQDFLSRGLYYTIPWMDYEIVNKY